MARRRKVNPWNAKQKLDKLHKSYEGKLAQNAEAGLKRRADMKKPPQEKLLARRKEFIRGFLNSRTQGT